jgi:hypothetical protein
MPKHITPSGDVDVYRVVFAGGSCAFNPRIQLIDVGGTGTLRMNVYDSSACTTGMACAGTEGGNSTKALTEWKYTYSAACGVMQAIDPTPVNGPFATLTYYVRVYSTNSASTSCQPYRLTITN